MSYINISDDTKQIIDSLIEEILDLGNGEINFKGSYNIFSKKELAENCTTDIEELKRIMYDGYLSKISKMSYKKYEDFFNKLDNEFLEEFFDEVRSNYICGNDEVNIAFLDYINNDEEIKEFFDTNVVLTSKPKNNDIEFCQYGLNNGSEYKRIYLKISSDNRLDVTKKILQSFSEKDLEVNFKVENPKFEREEGFVFYCTEENFDSIVDSICEIKNNSPNLFEGTTQVGYFTDFSDGVMSIADSALCEGESFNSLRYSILDKALELTYEEMEISDEASMDNNALYEYFEVLCNMLNVDPSNLSKNISSQVYITRDTYDEIMNMSSETIREIMQEQDIGIQGIEDTFIDM